MAHRDCKCAHNAEDSERYAGYPQKTTPIGRLLLLPLGIRHIVPDPLSIEHAHIDAVANLQFALMGTYQPGNAKDTDDAIGLVITHMLSTVHLLIEVEHCRDVHIAFQQAIPH